MPNMPFRQHSEIGSAFGPESFTENTTSWDKFVIGAYTMPGVCKVTPKKKRKVDVQQKAGHSKMGVNPPRYTYLGAAPAEVEVECTIWTHRQWNVMQKILQAYSPTYKETSKSITAIDVMHPALTVHRIYRLFLMEVEGPHPGKVQGSMEIKFKFSEFWPELKSGVPTPTTKVEASIVGIPNQFGVSVNGVTQDFTAVQPAVPYRAPQTASAPSKNSSSNKPPGA